MPEQVSEHCVSVSVCQDSLSIHHALSFFQILPMPEQMSEHCVSVSVYQDSLSIHTALPSSKSSRECCKTLCEIRKDVGNQCACYCMVSLVRMETIHSSRCEIPHP